MANPRLVIASWVKPRDESDAPAAIWIWAATMSIPVISSARPMRLLMSARKIEVMIRHDARRTGDSMLDLNSRVDLNEVVSALLIDQELCGTGVSVLHSIGELDGVVQDSLTGLFGKMRGRGNLNNLWMAVKRLVEFPWRDEVEKTDLLVTTLDGTVSLEQMDTVVVTIGQKLDLDMSRVVKESCTGHLA